MIATYLDTSALVRLCTGEGELAPAEEAMAGLPVTSVLAGVELAAAIHARHHRGMVNDADLGRLLSVGAEILQVIAQLGVSAAVRREAVSVVDDHLLRALDALHLGTAEVIRRTQRRRGNELRFCTADRRQADAARARFGEKEVVLLAGLSAESVDERRKQRS